MSYAKVLKDVKSQIREMDVETLRKTVEAQKGQAGDGNGAGPILIDVREKDEWVEGSIPGARSCWSWLRIRSSRSARSPEPPDFRWSRSTRTWLAAIGCSSRAEPIRLGRVRAWPTSSMSTRCWPGSGTVPRG